MQVDRRRSTGRNGVIAGSVWERRIKMDEGNGGIKVFNGENQEEKEEIKQSQNSNGVEKKRKTWKTDVFDSTQGNQIWFGKSNSSESCKEFGICKEKTVSRSIFDLGNIRSVSFSDTDENSDGENERQDEMKIEKQSFDVKEIRVHEDKLDKNNGDLQKDYQIRQNQNKATFNKTNFDAKQVRIAEEKLKKLMSEVKTVNEIQKTPASIETKKHRSPVIEHPSVDPDLIKIPSKIEDDEFQDVNVFNDAPKTTSKLQSMVDLVMWRDVSRTSLVFGLGALLLSSSLAEDLNFSFISLMSYLGLVYLASIFFYKSILQRETVHRVEKNQNHNAIREDEAVRFVKLILPYINEFIFKLGCLFSGDPSITMKLAVFLFIVAKCGSFITPSFMAKIVFLGVFIIPKVCSSYSAQLSSYGKFWNRRFVESWDSCPHKKVAAAIIFTTVWSIAAAGTRIWAVFLLAVAIRFHQQSLGEGQRREESQGQRREESQGQRREESQGQRERQKAETLSADSSKVKKKK